MRFLFLGSILLLSANCSHSTSTNVGNKLPYTIVDTGQVKTFNEQTEISAPSKGADFYGQDAQFPHIPMSYTDNKDGTISDNKTGLMWEKSYRVLTYNNALLEVEKLNKEKYLGYSDWRLPSIKELYSIMNFKGADIAPEDNNHSGTPFISEEYFDFVYGSNGRRPIDTQLVSSTEYVTTTMNGTKTVFGLNVADGRIKGYGYGEGAFGAPHGGGDKEFTVRYVRGNKLYGINDFVDNQNGTITDKATALMWAKDDSQKGFTWKEALAYVNQLNEENYLGYSDWRLPNAKELQSILDYSRSPKTTKSAAIDPIFNISTITIEDGSTDYPFFHTSTTHENTSRRSGGAAVYMSFGESPGFMRDPRTRAIEFMDVHGAGSQRSDPKIGNPADYPQGHGPQGDVIRIYNYVRPVRYAK